MPCPGNGAGKPLAQHSAELRQVRKIKEGEEVLVGVADMFGAEVAG